MTCCNTQIITFHERGNINWSFYDQQDMINLEIIKEFLRNCCNKNDVVHRNKKVLVYNKIVTRKTNGILERNETVPRQLAQFDHKR